MLLCAQPPPLVNTEAFDVQNLAYCAHTLHGDLVWLVSAICCAVCFEQYPQVYCSWPICDSHLLVGSLGCTLELGFLVYDDSTDNFNLPY